MPIIDESERLLTLGLVGLGLAHELATPLSTTALGLELLLERLEANPELPPREIAGELSAHLARVQRMAELVQRFRGFARGTGGKREQLRLSQLVDTVIELVRPAISELSGVRVFRGAIDDQAIVEADRLLLEQALSCLVLNGADATAGRALAGEVRLDVGVDETTAYIAVVDNGSGFAALDAAKTVGHSSKPDGLGAGLALATQITLSAGGTIELSNRPEGGATVTLRLPSSSP